MNQWKRFLLQSFLWLVVWLILAAGQNFNSNYLIDNSVAYLFQVCLIAGLIFYGAKSLLFKKKYFLFAMISLISIVFCAQISSNLRANQQRQKPPIETRPEGPPPRIGNGPGNHLPRGSRPIMPRGVAPTKFFIHFLMLSISFIVAAFIEAFIYARRKEEAHLKVEREHLQTELKLLKTQINPHFLFNSLNNIYALTTIDARKTQQSISNLSDMLRYVLYECERPKVFLKKEIDYIENYIKLFSLKRSKGYNIHTNYEISDEMIPVAPMIFIPFVENALKHSHIEKGKEAFITIEIKASYENIELHVKNSKPKESFHKDDVGGIGLDNVRKRLAILYPGSHSLRIEDGLSEFSIYLMINN